MKTKALKYWRKNWLLYCSRISSVPYPRSWQYEEGSTALEERKELTEGHINAMAPWRKHFQSFENRNFEAAIKHPHLSLIYKYQTVKYIYIIWMMQLYFHHRVLLAECTNCFASAVVIYFITPKPHKREPFICHLTNCGLYLFHTTAQHNNVVLFLHPADPGWTLWLSSLFSFLHFSMWTPAMVLLAALWCWAQWQQEGQVTKWLHLSCLSPIDDFSHSLYPAG